MEMRAYLETLKFPSDELMEDSFTKLLHEGVTLKQLCSLTKDDYNELGLAEEATAVILQAVDIQEVRSVQISSVSSRFGK